MSEPNKGRIAISFGSSKSIKHSSRPNPPSTLGKRPRSNAWGGNDSDPEDDHKAGKHETITAFGIDGAENDRIKKEKPKQYVISKLPNADWRADVRAQRRGKNLLPEEARAAQNANGIKKEPEVDTGDTGIKWGLTVKEKPAKDEEPEEPKAKIKIEDHPQPEDGKAPQRSVNDEAMDALLGLKPSKAQLSIPTETDAYLKSVSTAGEASTLADYEAMPVEEFGAALLRGMGWNGKERGAKPKEVKRRPARLGLGAKELKDAEELGGWSQGGGKKRPRLADYRREEDKKNEGTGREHSYKRERERERDERRHGHHDSRPREDRHRDRDREHDRHRDRHHDRHRDRR